VCFSLFLAEEPLLSPSLKRELAHLEHFEIRHVSQDNKFDKSILLECSLGTAAVLKMKFAFQYVSVYMGARTLIIK